VVVCSCDAAGGLGIASAGEQILFLFFSPAVFLPIPPAALLLLALFPAFPQLLLVFPCPLGTCSPRCQDFWAGIPRGRPDASLGAPPWIALLVAHLAPFSFSPFSPAWSPFLRPEWGWRLCRGCSRLGFLWVWVPGVVPGSLAWFAGLPLFPALLVRWKCPVVMAAGYLPPAPPVRRLLLWLWRDGGVLSAALGGAHRQLLSLPSGPLLGLCTVVSRFPSYSPVSRGLWGEPCEGVGG